MNDKDYFHSELHYKRYLYAVYLTEKINDLLDKGYIIFNDNGETLPEKARFIFREGEEKIPALLLSWDKTMAISYLDEWSDDSMKKYWVRRTKKEWKELFSSWKAINPKDIKRIRLT